MLGFDIGSVSCIFAQLWDFQPEYSDLNFVPVLFSHLWLSKVMGLFKITIFSYPSTKFADVSIIFMACLLIFLALLLLL